MWFDHLYGTRVVHSGQGRIHMHHVMHERLVSDGVIRLRLEWCEVDNRNAECVWIGMLVPGQPLTEVVRTPEYSIHVGRDLPSPP